jgi:NAD(P)H-dependent flavin oxidoreductase YrpB (nitropropane dioxygenase family)
MEFIFMLTRDDRTLADARSIYDSAAEAGVRSIGCKDVGLPADQLADLISAIRRNGDSSFLEVVSESAEASLDSARVAREAGPDYLIGSTIVEPILEVLQGTDVRFFPYIGDVYGHPCRLRGTIRSIAEDARRKEALGVAGINLLAYRYDGDVSALVKAVVAATSLPVVCAGSIDSAERIRELRELGVWAFTIGTAALDGTLVPGRSLNDQLRAALAAAEEYATT